MVAHLDMLDQLRRGHIISDLRCISDRAGHCEFADDRIDNERPLCCGIGEGLITVAAEIDPMVLEDAGGSRQVCGNSSDRLADESGNIAKLIHGSLRRGITCRHEDHSALYICIVNTIIGRASTTLTDFGLWS